MKFYKIILFASIILTIYSDTCQLGTKGDSKKDCDKLDKLTDHPYCCFIKGKDQNGDEAKICAPLTKTEYDNIKDFKKSLESGGAKIKKIDCKSIYLELSILSFIFLLL